LFRAAAERDAALRGPLPLRDGEISRSRVLRELLQSAPAPTSMTAAGGAGAGAGAGQHAATTWALATLVQAAAGKLGGAADPRVEAAQASFNPRYIGYLR
jgi:hypothetical protein